MNVGGRFSAVPNSKAKPPAVQPGVSAIVEDITAVDQARQRGPKQRILDTEVTRGDAKDTIPNAGTSRAHASFLAKDNVIRVYVHDGNVELAGPIMKRGDGKNRCV